LNALLPRRKLEVHALKGELDVMLLSQEVSSYKS
jgi:hypothetical protein